MIKFNIKKLRILNGNISQKMLSETTGIRYPTLQSYEYSKAKTINVKHIDALCKAFHCEPKDIITYIPDEEVTGNADL